MEFINLGKSNEPDDFKSRLNAKELRRQIEREKRDEAQKYMEQILLDIERINKNNENE